MNRMIMCCSDFMALWICTHIYHTITFISIDFPSTLLLGLGSRCMKWCTKILTMFCLGTCTLTPYNITKCSTLHHRISPFSFLFQVFVAIAMQSQLNFFTTNAIMIYFRIKWNCRSNYAAAFAAFHLLSSPSLCEWHMKSCIPRIEYNYTAVCFII